MLSSTADQPRRTQSCAKSSAFAAGAACLALFVVSVLLLQAYSLLHFDIISRNRTALHEPLKGELFKLLNRLEIYRLSALFSFGFDLWAFWGLPCWVRWACLPVIVISMFMMFVLI